MIIPIWGSLTSGGSISAAAFAVSASFLAIGGGVAHENKGRTPTIIRIAGGASVVAAAVPAIALGHEIFALRRNVPLGAISHHKPSRAHYGGYTYTRTTGSGTGTTRGGHGAMCAMAVCAAAGVVGAGLVGSGAGQDNSEAPGTPQDDSSSNEYDTDNSIDEETGGAGNQSPSSGDEQNEADDSDMAQDEEDEDSIFDYLTGGGGGSPPPAPSGTNSGLDNNGDKNFNTYLLNWILAVTFAIFVAFKKIGGRRSATQIERSIASSAMESNADKDHDIITREPDTLARLLDNGLHGLSNLVATLEFVPLHDSTPSAPIENKHSKTSPAFLDNISPQTTPLLNILDMCLVGSAPDSLDNRYYGSLDNSTNDAPGFIEVYLPPSAQEAMQMFAALPEEACTGWITSPRFMDFALGISIVALYYGMKTLEVVFHQVRHWTGVVTASLFILPAETPARADDSVSRLDINESVTNNVADEGNASANEPDSSALTAPNMPNMTQDAQDVNDEIAGPTTLDSVEPITPTFADASHDVHTIDDECPSEPNTTADATPNLAEPNAASNEPKGLQDIIPDSEPAAVAIDELSMKPHSTAVSDILQDANAKFDNEITTPTPTPTPNVNYLAMEATTAYNAVMVDTLQDEQEAVNNIAERAPTDTTVVTETLQHEQEVDIDSEDSAGFATVVEELPISRETEPDTADINSTDHDDEDDPNYEFHYPGSADTTLSEIAASQALLALGKQGVQQAITDIAEENAVQAAPEAVEQAVEPVEFISVKGIIQKIFTEMVEQTDRPVTFATAEEVVEQQHGPAASGTGLGSVEQVFLTDGKLQPQASVEGDESGLGTSIHAPGNFVGRPKKMLPRRAKVVRAGVRQSVVTEQPAPVIFNFKFGKGVGSLQQRSPSEASEDVVVAQQRRSQSPTESSGSGLGDSIHAPGNIEDRRVKSLPRRRVRATSGQVANNIDTTEQPRPAVSSKSVETVEAVEVASPTDAKDDTSVDQQQPRTPTVGDVDKSGLGESIHVPSNTEDKSLPPRAEAEPTALEELEAKPTSEAKPSSIPVYAPATASKPPGPKRSKKRRGRHNN